MAAHKIKCFEPRCTGVPFAINDGASRMAEHLGQAHYKCDKCSARWSVDVAWYLEKLKPDPRPVRNLR